MDCNTFAQLTAFRQQLHACFYTAGDALFSCVDALLSETPARSLAELSLSPFFVRKWPSLYQALQEASVDRAALQRLFAAYVALPATGERLVLGIDASSIARPCSQTAEDRTYVQQSNLPEGCKPIRPGWQFSTLTVLPHDPSSWTYVLDNTRVPSTQTQGEAAAGQLCAMLPLLPCRALLLGDGYDGSVTFLLLLADIACDVLLRFARNRVLFRPAPPKTNKRGAPKKEGARFACHDEATHGPPDTFWQGTDACGQEVQGSAWHGLHFKKARDIIVSVIRIVRPCAKNTDRDPRPTWFLWRGQNLPPLSKIAGLYRRRYSQEHGYRVDKQNLLWEQPRLRTPEQFQTWTDVVAATHNLLFACPSACAGNPPTLGKQGANPDATADTAQHGDNSATVGHTGPTTPTPRKIAGASGRSNPRESAHLQSGLQGHQQETQGRAKSLNVNYRKPFPMALYRSFRLRLTQLSPGLPSQTLDQVVKRTALAAILGASFFMLTASCLMVSSVPLRAQTQSSGEDTLLKSIEKRLNGLRKLPDEERTHVTKQVALDIRQLPAPETRLGLASSFANLATRNVSRTLRQKSESIFM